MAKVGDMTKMLGRTVTPVPDADAAPAAPAPQTNRRWRLGEGREAALMSEQEEALGTDVPASLKRELKLAAVTHGEKMKHVVARAIRRELDRMKETE